MRISRLGPTKLLKRKALGGIMFVGSFKEGTHV